jgi:hypothetical protein
MTELTENGTMAGTNEVDVSLCAVIGTAIVA